MQGVVDDEQREPDQKKVKERLTQPPPQPRRTSRQRGFWNGVWLLSRSIAWVLYQLQTLAARTVNARPTLLINSRLLVAEPRSWRSQIRCCARRNTCHPACRRSPRMATC